MFEVNDIPPIDVCELQELIGENVRHEEFLFFRINHGDDLDWILGEADDYECFCTACQQHFAEDRKSGPASYWDTCPRCGARITPRRWNSGKAKFLALTAFAFHFFQPGEHGDMWLTSCQVRMNPDFQSGKYLANEYARYCFSEFGSRKWIWKENGWKRTKSICFKRWQAMGGYCYDNFWALPSEQELTGSCLRYSQLTQAWSCVPDLPEYLAFYLKFPGAEYLWKMGFGRWLVERQEGKGHLFRKLVNLRANEPKRLFLHLSKADRRLLGRERVNLADGVAYQELRQAGVVECSEDGLQYACATVRCRFVWQTTAEQCGLSGKELRKYIERQARRSGLTIGAVMHEFTDYQAQLERLAPNADRLPDDLHEAHARLSGRERRLMNREKNEKFRTRRHLLAWMRWKYKGMFIRPIDSAEEIVREGEEQNNCVAGYANRHADGKTIILVLRKRSEPRKPWHTVEIDPATLECRQCYAAHNHKRTPEAAEFMDKYLDHLREVTKMIRRSA